MCSFGKHVAVVEAHSAAGGAAHHWTRGAFSFDSGAALFSGINPLRPEEANGSDATTANPLSSVLAALGESVPDVIDMPDSATCLVYPDGKQYRCQLGSTAFADVVEERYGSEASKQWRGFQDEVDRLCVTAGAVPPAAVRLDDGTIPAVMTSPCICNLVGTCPGGAGLHSQKDCLSACIVPCNPSSSVRTGTCSCMLRNTLHVLEAFKYRTVQTAPHLTSKTTHCYVAPSVGPVVRLPIEMCLGSTSLLEPLLASTTQQVYHPTSVISIYAAAPVYVQVWP